MEQQRQWWHPDSLWALGRTARRDFENHYTAEHQLKLLLDIYDEARSSPRFQ